MASYKLIVSDRITEDLFRLSTYLSKSKFKDLRIKLKEKFRDINNMPKMYSRIYYDKKNKADFRKIIHEKYIIIYKIQKSQIIILRVVSEKENYLKPKLLKIY